jgi:cytochrome c nitrite reductase small subunit
MRWIRTKLGLAFALLFGLLVGVGTFTFDYAKGASYFSTDPTACANCHVMQEYFDSWQKGTHHTAAKCIDCHLPHEFVHKYIAKADEGMRHSWAFTFQNFHEPIEIIPRDARILQNNCLRCHGDLVHALVNGKTADANDIRCVHCHLSVGHGP